MFRYCGNTLTRNNMFRTISTITATTAPTLSSSSSTSSRSLLSLSSAYTVRGYSRLLGKNSVHRLGQFHRNLLGNSASVHSGTNIHAHARAITKRQNPVAVTASYPYHLPLSSRTFTSESAWKSAIPSILASSSSGRASLLPSAITMTERYRPKAFGRTYSENLDDSSDAASVTSSSGGSGAVGAGETGGGSNNNSNNKPKTFTYQVSASYSAKFKKWEASNTFNFNPYNKIPYETNWAARKRARPKTGQDAFFVSRISDTGAIAFGVADGVGGYNDSGIDSADFSHTLCEDIADIAHGSPNIPRVTDLLAQGYDRVSHNEHVEGGASTACMGIAKPDGQIETANLGDSGYIILRCGRVHFASPPQTHAFNTPYQLSVIPKVLLEQALRFGGAIPFSDRPQDAAVDVHSLQHGDVLIFATDGVWDNLSSQDVLRVCSEEMLKSKGWVMTEAGFAPGVNLAAVADDSGSTSLQSVLARAVAARAKVMSVNTKVDGPFAKEVQKVYPGEAYHGGKKDDICVVCVIVLEDSIEAAFVKGGVQGRNGLPGGGGPGAPTPKL